MQEDQMIQFREFSRYPGAGRRVEGEFSGEEFRESLLKPALLLAIRRGNRVVLNIDGTIGLSTSFSREAFGGLVQACNFSLAELKKHLSIVGDDPSSRVYIDDAWKYIVDAASAVSVH